MTSFYCTLVLVSIDIDELLGFRRKLIRCLSREVCVVSCPKLGGLLTKP